MTFNLIDILATASLFQDFSQVLSTVDQLVLMDIYSAGENPIIGADGPTLFASVKKIMTILCLFLSPKENRLLMFFRCNSRGRYYFSYKAPGDIGGIAVKLAERIYCLKRLFMQN